MRICEFYANDANMLMFYSFAFEFIILFILRYFCLKLTKIANFLFRAVRYVLPENNPLELKIF